MKLSDQLQVIFRWIGHRPRPVAWLLFYTRTKDNLPMASFVAPNITTAQLQPFSLTGYTPAGATFVEPTVTLSAATTAAGTITMQASVQLTPDASGGTPFTTAGLFTPAPGYTGPVELDADVQGIEDSTATFQVVAVPAPESVAFNPNSWGPIEAPPAAGTGTVASTGSLSA